MPHQVHNVGVLKTFEICVLLFVFRILIKEISTFTGAVLLLNLLTVKVVRLFIIVLLE